jgi:TRAP transporter TAXI family solute receptor
MLKIKNFSLFFITFFMFFINLNAGANFYIATGSKSGTYYSFGKEIFDVCKLNDNFYPISTKGSLDNLIKLSEEPNVKFAIVQYDAMSHIISSNKYSNRLKKRVNKLRVVSPLYTEEIHVITRKDLKLESKEDFKSLRVSVGEKNSGTYITARRIAQKTGIRWKKTKYLNAEKSLKALKNNEIDVAFYVVGSPAKLFQVDDTNSLKAIELQQNIKFSDILTKLPELDNYYSTMLLFKNDYKWLNEERIQTKGVQSVLITYNYKEYQPSYKRVKKLYSCLYQNKNTFKNGKNFHKKWSEFEPKIFSSIPWKKHPAVSEFLEEIEIENNKIPKEIENDDFFD